MTRLLTPALTLFAALVVCVGIAAPASVAQAQERPRVVLWPEGAPGAVGDEEADRPSIEIYAPPAGTANGCAVVVCPGGGYRNLALGHEGDEIGQWLNGHGVTAFVLRYRLSPRYAHPAPLQDVQRAVRTVRSRAGEWGVDPERVGVMGFSAGGHLASSAGTHFNDNLAPPSDEIDRASARPDFLILCYPVITFTQEFVHAGSRRSLLGESPDPELVRSFSNETQVTPETPPTFLFHTTEDAAVPPENSAVFYLALRKAGVPAELHIYEHGRHGVGLARGIAGTESWSALLAEWLRGRGLLTAAAPSR